METIFFAYESGNRSKTQINVDAIKEAQKELGNSRKFRIKTWEELSISGRVLIKTIFEAIDECDIFACDLTFSNYNIYFELGYAISKQKKLLLLINPELDQDDMYSKFDSMRNVGYSNFKNSKDIIDALEKIDPNKTLNDDLSIILPNITHEILYINSGSNSQAELNVLTYLQKSDYKMIFDDPSEVEYRTFKWYIESISTSQFVIVHIADASLSIARLNNIKASLYAGISVGLNKKTVLLASNGYNAPIDYSDIVIRYKNADESLSCLEKWIDKNKYLLKPSAKKEREYNLLKLGLGYETAENERYVLNNYFIETAAYNDAIKNNRAFLIGRKGTGKTALYIVVNDYFKDRENTFVVDLKPESSELLENIDVTNMFSDIAKKYSFFYSIWRFIIYSKVIISIAVSIKPEYYSHYEEKSIEKRIVDFYSDNKSILEQHFFETFNLLIPKNDENKLKLFHEKYIDRSCNLIKEYLRIKKYANIVVMADNLDKTWSVENDLSVQVDMVLSLFEITSKIENELKSSQKQEINIKTLLFLREDIFDYVLKNAREPDKLMLYKKEMDWANFPDKLRLLLEQRFKYSLNLPNDSDVNYIWLDYFNFSKSKNASDVFEYIRSACLPRPRDLLVFVGYLFESAVNNSHDKVEDMDFEYAIRGYSKFLYQNITVELKTKYSNIQNILEELHVKYEDMFEYEKFRDTLTNINGSIEITKNLIDDFIETGYLTVFNINTGEKYHSYKLAEENLKASFRKFWFIKLKPKSPNIYVNLGPNYNRKVSQKEELSNKNKRNFWDRIVKQ